MTAAESELLAVEPALVRFLKAAQNKVDERYASLAPRQSATLSAEEGPKYTRIVLAEKSGARSAFCFVEKATGNVLKAAGWRVPEKRNPRSNIHDADAGSAGVSGYGAVSLR